MTQHPNLVVLFGPPAVGKMSVGQALAELTGYRLFHNHMTIDLVLPFFDYGTMPFRRLVKEFRHAIFEEVAKSHLPGLIFTWVWAFDIESDRYYIDTIAQIFRQQGGEVYFVGLHADDQALLDRNKTPNRLAHKPSKQDLIQSEKNLKDTLQKHQLRIPKGYHMPGPHMEIDNTALSPEAVAEKINAAFRLG